MNTLLGLVAAIVIVNLSLVYGAATSAAASPKHRQHHRPMCPVCFYRNHLTGICTACDLCPPNQVIRRPCTRHRNTVCGLFTEFTKTKFQFAPLRISDVLNSKSDVSTPDIDGQQLGQQGGDGAENSVSVTRGGWKVLTMSMIGALVFLAVFLFVIVFMACYLIKRKTRQDKQLLEQTDCDNQSFHPFVFMEGGEKQRAGIQATPMLDAEDEGIVCYRETSEDVQELLDEDITEDHFQKSTVQISSSSATSPRSNPFSHVVISGEDSRAETAAASTSSSSSLASSLFHIIHNPLLSLEHHPSLAPGQNNGQQDYVYFNPPVNSYILKK